MVNPGSRQIYLTFPADSTFREEDYLWTNSRCEDSISTKENVWVLKPYKEKGKVPDKYRHSLFSSVYVMNSSNKLTCSKPISSKVGD
ncbi:hypothetical protein CsSME_00030457 [Camellia sinensis var. sinensis]